MSVDDMIRERLGALVEPVDVEAVTTSIEERARSARPRFRRPMLGAAAAVVLALCIYGAASIGDDRSVEVRSVPATRPTAPSTTAPGTTAPRTVHFDVIGSRLAGLPAGSLMAVTDQARLDVLRSGAATGPAVDGPLPAIDFDKQVLLLVNIPGGRCAADSGFDHFDTDGTTLTAVVGSASTGNCDPPDATRTYLGTLDWAETGPSFRVRMPADPEGRYPETTILVTGPSRSEEAPAPPDAPVTTVESPVATLPRVPATTAPQEPSGPNLRTTPPPNLTGRLELSATSVASGGSIPGVVTVENNTGGPVQIGYCMQAFSIELHGQGMGFGFGHLACLQNDRLPVGVSRWPVEVHTGPTNCIPDTPPPGSVPACAPMAVIPVPPGTYKASVHPPVGAVFAIPDVSFTVTPSG